jgi:hypothetical protein
MSLYPGVPRPGLKPGTPCCTPRHRVWVSKIQNLSEWWRPPAIVTEIVAEMITLAWEMFENRRCPGERALLGERMRNGPASESAASGGASFVTMVKTADLRDREHSAQTRRMHFPWFRRVLLQRQVRTGRVIVRKIRRQDSVQTGLIANDHVIQAFPPISRST